MKTVALAAGIVAISAMSASAADLSPRYAKAPPAPAVQAVFNWSGIYLGANGGCGFDQQRINNFDTNGDGFPDDFVGAFDSIGGGCFGGGQIGFNYQLSNNFVLGIEADGDFGSIRGKGALSEDIGDNSINHGETRHYEHRLTSFGTVRGRIGYAFGRWLPYVTGGWAWGKNRETVVEFSRPDVDIITNTSAGSATHYGWTAGAGLEVAIDQNWSVKGEYLFLNLGSKDYGVTFEGSDNNLGPSNLDLKVHTVKLGVNYRFSWGNAPY